MQPIVLLKRISLAGLSLMVSFLVVEGIFRFYDIEPGINERFIDSQNAENRCSEASTLRGYTPTLGKCGRNSLGLFGPEVGTLNPDRPRVLVLGDSLTVPRGWLDIVAENIKELKFLNSAVSGYETCQELNLMNELIPLVHPDRVIVQMTPNDIGGSPVLIPLDDGRARYFLASKAFDFPIWVLSFKSIAYLTLRLGAARNAQEMNSSDHAEQYTRRCLEEIRDTVHPDQLLAILFPSLLPLENNERDAWRSELKIEGMLQELQIPHISLRATFEAGGDIRRLQRQSRDNIHPSAEGHELAAAAIERFVREQERQAH